jgi:hypothetical protein
MQTLFLIFPAFLSACGEAPSANKQNPGNRIIINKNLIFALSKVHKRDTNIRPVCGTLLWKQNVEG